MVPILESPVTEYLSVVLGGSPVQLQQESHSEMGTKCHLESILSDSTCF